ncbi:MAG: ABC transporter permease [Anaerolineae bacterium]|nr:ABC transporter permease [Anaerolineae bacterium]
MFDDMLFQNVVDGIFSAAFLASMLRVTTPILLPSLGALISDRAGVINIGLEGTMLASAFTGVVFSAKATEWISPAISDPMLPWVGLLMGVLVGLLMALLLAFFHLQLKANLILSGIALNILGSSATVAIMYELTGDRGNTKGNLASFKMPFVQLPEFLADIPILSFFFKIFDNQSVMTWIAFFSVAFVWWFMYRTPVGTHLRAVGENPDAAASVGIRVQRIRYLALLMSGVFAGLGGIHMSMGYLAFFQKDMTSGRGFIALATPYLGGGNPIGTGFASLIFGFFDAISTRIGSLEIPSQLPQMVPFVATVMALVIYALQSQLTSRVRTLRSAEGEEFDVNFWGSIRRLSVLHMFLAMLAIIGIIIAVSMFSAPDGFKGAGENLSTGKVVSHGVAIALVSLALIVINLPFMLNVERIGHWRWWYSAGASVLSLWIYLSVFFILFLIAIDGQGVEMADTLIIVLGLALGLISGALIWLRLGGQYLTHNHHLAAVAAA